MKYVVFLVALLFSAPAFAQAVYPVCASNSQTSCTLTVHVTINATPVFKHFSGRTYLFLQNTGYTFGNGLPALNNNVVMCAIGSNNNPIGTSGTGTNVMVIEPGGVWEPEQIVKPQSTFTVPAGDVSCVAPFGDVYLTALEE